MLSTCLSTKVFSSSSTRLIGSWVPAGGVTAILGGAGGPAYEEEEANPEEAGKDEGAGLV